MSVKWLGYVRLRIKSLPNKNYSFFDASNVRGLAQEEVLWNMFEYFWRKLTYDLFLRPLTKNPDIFTIRPLLYYFTFFPKHSTSNLFASVHGYIFSSIINKNYRIL